jgi:Domain of unknown function (DUF4350)
MLKSIVPFAVVVVVLLGLVVWVYPSNRDFGPENPSWNGLKSFCSDFKPAKVSSLGELPPSAQETALVLIPYEGFDDFDLQAIEQYTASGGTLVLMDDYGFGNQALDYLYANLDDNVRPRFTNDVLLDPLFNFANSHLPTLRWLPPGKPAGEEKTIVLNHATSLENVADDSVIAWSSRFSYLDLNNNSAWEEEEPSGPFPVACSMSYQSGHIVLMADPSILIMLNRDDDLEFFENLISTGQVKPAIILDESHLPPSRLERSQGVLQTLRSALSSSAGVVVMVLVVLLLVMFPVWRKGLSIPSLKRFRKGDSHE